MTAGTTTADGTLRSWVFTVVVSSASPFLAILAVSGTKAVAEATNTGVCGVVGADNLLMDEISAFE